MVEVTAKGLSRKERVKAFKQREILLAAQRVFAEKGYEQATIEEIADAAEFSKGALYNYFEHKEEMFLALIDSGFEDFDHIVHAAFDHAAPVRDQFQTFTRDVLEYFEKNRDFLTILVRENLQVKVKVFGEFREQFYERREHLIDIIAHALQQGIDAGTIRPSNPHYLVEVFWNIMFAAMLHHHYGQPSYDPVDAVVDIVTIFFDGVNVR